jgi:glycerol uptake facilitator-like aquaporin
MGDTPSLSRRLLAEGLGTAILVATVVGSGIMAERLAGGNQAIALLGNTIPTGAILIVIITIFAPVSGAHFNPAVTLIFATRGETPWGEVIPYVVVQCVGGIVGTAVAHLMFDLTPLAIGTNVRSGPSQWLAEAVATFTLVLAILGGLRYAPHAIPWRSASRSPRRIGSPHRHLLPIRLSHSRADSRRRSLASPSTTCPVSLSLSFSGPELVQSYRLLSSERASLD